MSVKEGYQKVSKSGPTLSASSLESECGLSRRPSGDSERCRLVERVHRFEVLSRARDIEAREDRTSLDRFSVLCGHCETDTVSALLCGLVPGGVS